MTVHLVKLCVGANSVGDLAGWVEKRSADNERARRGRIHEHVTRMHPRREAALLDDGSIYWVIKGVILARQRLIGFERREGADGIQRCAILIDPPLVLTEPQSRRAFQGWRYLSAMDAPPDAKQGPGKNPPTELAIELAELGLL